MLFVFAGGGAGDAKMMGALGAWLGLANGVVALVAVALSGAVIGLGYALIKGKAATTAPPWTRDRMRCGCS